MPAIRSTLTWANPCAAIQGCTPEHLPGGVGAAVLAQDIVVHVLDAEAEAGHPDLPDRPQLGLGQRSRLALEGDLSCRVPGQRRLQPRRQRLEVAGAYVGGGAAAEVDEPQLAAGDPGGAGVQLHLARHRVEVLPDLRGVLVDVDAEVAELAALAAERYVQVEAEVGKGLRLRRGVEKGTRRGDVALVPERVRRVVGDEDAADLGVGQQVVEAGGRRFREVGGHPGFPKQ